MSSGTRSDPSAPERRAGLALLLIDVINPMDFEGAEELLESAIPAAKSIRGLVTRARDSKVPIIYVNDNFHCWHLGFRELIAQFTKDGVPGLPIITLLEPDLGNDFYILKPSHSGFYRTPLEVLLQRLGTHTLILTGFAGDICVLFTANDAYMRTFHIVVPRDCVASERSEDNAYALTQMERLLKADTSSAVTWNEDRLRELNARDSPSK